MRPKLFPASLIFTASYFLIASSASAQTIYDITSIGQPVDLTIGSGTGQIAFGGNFNIDVEETYDFQQISALFRGQASTTGNYAAGTFNTSTGNADSTVNSLTLSGGNSLITGNLPYDMLGTAAPLFVNRSTLPAVEVFEFDEEEEAILRRLSLTTTKSFDFTTVTGSTQLELVNNFPQGGALEMSLQIRSIGDDQVNTSTVGLRVKPGMVAPDSFSTNGLFRWDLMGNTTDGAGSNWTQIDFTGNTATFTSGTQFVIAFDRTTDFTNSFWQQDRSWQIFSGGTIGGDAAGSYVDNTDFLIIGGVNGPSSVPAAYSGSYFSFDPGTGTLNWSAVPEPSTALAGLLLTAGLLRRRRSTSKLASR